MGGGASKDTPIKAHLNRFQGEDTEKQNYGESTVLISATRTSMRRIAPSRNITIFIQAASDLGLSGAHEQLVVSYLTSSRRQRSQSLKTIEATFKDFKESRLNEDTYTREIHA